MKTKKKLSELTLNELQNKHKKINKLTVTIQIILLIISVTLLIDVFISETQPRGVILITLSVIFIPFLTGLNQINQELRNRNI